MTGVLPIVLEESRKVVQALLSGGKKYVCVMKLHEDIKKEKVEKILKEFETTIYQRPPVRSSVKRRLRTRKIYFINFLQMKQRDALFETGCEAGTYIRKLCHDIGEALGCGAHMQELRRTRAGPFAEDESLVTLHDVAYWFMEWQEKRDKDILRKFIQPMEKTLALMPKIHIRDSAVDAVCHGANLAAPGVLSLETGIVRGSTIAILTLKGEVVALAEAKASTGKILSMQHGVVAEIKRVLMSRGTYPKRWGDHKVKD